MSQIIPRTDAIESIINTRNKFLFGSDVHVGDEFSGWEDTYGHHYYGYCRALHYDGKYLFVLYRQNGDNVTLLDGNMANYHGMLVVERGRNTYSIRDLRKRVDKYLQLLA